MFSLRKTKKSKQSLQYYSNKISWLSRNLVFVIIFCVIISTCLYAIYPLLLNLITDKFSSPSNSSYPTSIPWLTNKAECEHNPGRAWRDGRCWDYEHDPSF
ncbi:hypothetical protein NIES4106_29700 [Fischerella sp. NIES-4106]|jgi:hypothetical protein|nr:hypothetical protein NIES4106_29700 [Fischerella sp. NIES-4106]